jgi:hypothetical protein
MPSKATVSTALGPGRTLSSMVFNDVKKFDWVIDKNTIELVYGTDNRIVWLDAVGLSSVTHTIASGTHTITIS